MNDFEKLVRELILNNETDLAKRIVTVVPNYKYLLLEISLYNEDIEEAKTVYESLPTEKKEIYNQFFMEGGKEVLLSFLKIQTRIKNKNFKIPKELAGKIIEIISQEAENTTDEMRKRYLMGLLKRLNAKHKKDAENKQYTVVFFVLALVFIFGYTSIVLNLSLKNSSQISELKTDFASVKSSIDVVLKKFSEIEKLVTNVMEQTSQFEERMKELTNNNAILERNQEKLREEFEKFQKSIYENLSLLNSKNSELFKMLNEVQKPSELQNKKLIDLERNLNSLSSSLAELRNKITQIEKTYATYSKVPENSAQNMVQIESKLSALESKVTSVSKSVSGLSQKDSDISTRISSLQDLLNNNIRELEIMKEYIASLKLLKNDVEQLKQMYENLKKSYEELNKKVEQIASQGSSSKVVEVGKNLNDVLNLEPVTDLQEIAVNEKNLDLITNDTSLNDHSKESESLETQNIRQMWLSALDYYVNNEYNKTVIILKDIEKNIDNTDAYFKEELYYFLVDSYIRLSDQKSAEYYYKEYLKKFPSGKYTYSLERLLRK